MAKENMTAERETLRDSRLCSVISNAAGDDPGGTASAFDAYLAIELSPPWKSNVVESRHVPANLLKPLERIVSTGVVDKVTALMPDAAEYSREDHTRILYFKRSEGPFANYGKREYLLPDEELVPFVAALAEPGSLTNGLPRFEPYRETDTSHVRDILVCTHGARDVCCGKFGYPLYERLRHEYAAGNPRQNPDLRVWRTSHIGGHRFAPTLVDFPEGRYWGHLEPEAEPAALENLVNRTGPVSELRHFCRGWAGLTNRCEQIAEREAFVREGWDWTNYLRSGRTLSTSENGEAAEVQIEYTSPEGEVSGVYEALVEANGSVMTLGSSGMDPLEEVCKYRVSRLEKHPDRRVGDTDRTREAGGVR